MDKTAMDALNNGWALGIGTRVRRLDADFEAALARGRPVERKPERPISVPWALLLAAIGPVSRPQH